jgi:hypothetical protein
MLLKKREDPLVFRQKAKKNNKRSQAEEGMYVEQ